MESWQTTLDAPNGTIDDLEDVDWTFEGANTKEYTHGLHPYPARMVPQIPRHLLRHFLQKGVITEGNTVYDPFSGSGTTAVEARLAGLDSESNDINPLACTLTKAKARPLDLDLLEEAEQTLTEDLPSELATVREEYKTEQDSRFELPDIREGWFPKPQLHELSYLRERIDTIEEELTSEVLKRDGVGTADVKDVARFLRIALSKTTRQVSYQRNGEYKRYRIPEEKRDEHDPDVYAIFTDELEDNIERMRRFSSSVDHDLTTEVHYADSREAEDVKDNSADIVITSPPYGDHKTTVAYGQFSQDPAIIAENRGYDEMKAVDKNGLGGANRTSEPLSELRQWSPALSATIDSLEAKDGRADDAMGFFSDYYEVMKQVARILKPGQPVAWVVANRTMSRVNIPTHLITKELCEHLGFDHQTMLPREIPTKTLPWENAPENVTGQTGELMADENIVVMTAPDR